MITDQGRWDDRDYYDEHYSHYYCEDTIMKWTTL